MKKTVLAAAIKTYVLLLLFRAVFTRVLGIYLVKGSSMYPAMRDGDLCITYRLEPYTAGDAVAYVSGEQQSITFGRIIASAGDTVEITQEGLLLVNGYQPAEEVFYPTLPYGNSSSVKTVIGNDEWFILNDYRTDLSDSRVYGSFSSESLQGKVIWLIRRRGF